MIRATINQSIPFNYLTEQFGISNDHYTGNGIYAIGIGNPIHAPLVCTCHREIYQVSADNEFEYRSKEEIIDSYIDYANLDRVNQDFLKRLGSICESGKCIEQGTEYYFENITQRYSKRYYYVVE